MPKRPTTNKRQELQNKIDNFFEDSYFDVQGISPTSSFASIDEAYIARILTKLAIGSATVWWSILELKDFVILRKKSKAGKL